MGLTHKKYQGKIKNRNRHRFFSVSLSIKILAEVAELADALGSGLSGENHRGSTPLLGISFHYIPRQQGVGFLRIATPLLGISFHYIPRQQGVGFLRIATPLLGTFRILEILILIFDF